jgi:hypothetical protein
VTFTPIHDSYTKSSSPSSIYGSSSTLRVRKSSTETMNVYLKFDVAGISGVNSAKVRLYVTDDGVDAGKLHLVSNAYKGSTTLWKQSGINWNNAPEITGTPLSAVGAVRVGDWIEFDVTAAVHGDGLYSFALANASSNTIAFSSRDGANRPELVIDAASVSLALNNSGDSVEEAGLHPEAYALAQNYPNPFNPETQIVFTIPEQTFTKLTVYDVLGRQVAVLVDGALSAGRHQISWEGRDANGMRVSSGMYFYQLRTPGFTASRRMLLVQ